MCYEKVNYTLVVSFLLRCSDILLELLGWIGPAFCLSRGYFFGCRRHVIRIRPVLQSSLFDVIIVFRFFGILGRVWGNY